MEDAMESTSIKTPQLPREIWRIILRKQPVSCDLRSFARAARVSHLFQEIVRECWRTLRFLRFSCRTSAPDNALRLTVNSQTEMRVGEGEGEGGFWKVRELCRRFTGLQHLQFDTDLSEEEAEDFDEELKRLWKLVGKGIFHCFSAEVALERLEVWNEYVGLNLVSFLVAKFSHSLTHVDLSIHTTEQVAVDLLWSSLELCRGLRSLAYENRSGEDSVRDETLQGALEGKAELEELTLWDMCQVSHEGLFHALQSTGCSERLRTFRLVISGGVNTFFLCYSEMSRPLNSFPLAHVKCFTYRCNGDSEYVDAQSLFRVFPSLEELRMVSPATYREPGPCFINAQVTSYKSSYNSPVTTQAKIQGKCV